MRAELSEMIADPERLKTLASLGLPGGETPEDLARLVRLAARALGVPAAAFLLLGERGFLPRGTVGLPPALSGRDTWPLDWAFLRDAALGLTSASPSGAGGFPADSLPAFLGAPVTDRLGRLLGVLAFWDAAPREWPVADREAALESAAALGDALAVRTSASAHENAALELGRSEDALAAFRNEIDLVLKTLDTPIIAFSAEGKVLFANGAAAGMLGYADGASMLGAGREEITAQFDVLDEFMRPYPADRLPTLRGLSGEAVTGDLLGYRFKEDGTIRWVLAKSTPVKEEDERVRLVITVYQDVTNLKSAELELHKSRDELYVMLQTMEGACTAQDPKGNLVYANDAAARILDFPDAVTLMSTDPRHILDRFEILDEGMRPIPIDEIPSRMALAGRPVNARVLCYRVKATGSERWSLVNATPVFDDQGRVRLVMNVFTDITDLKKAQAEIQKSRNQLEIVLSGVDDSIFVSDFTGRPRLMYANQAAARLLDYPSVEHLMSDGAEAVAGRAILMDEAGRVIPPESLPARVAARGEVYPPTPIRMRLKHNGAERWVVVKATPIAGPDGRIEMVVNIAHDTTEVRRAQESVAKHLHYLEGMNRLSDAIERTLDVERVLPAAMAKLLDVFACDRAWLVVPGEAEGSGFRIPYSARRQAGGESPGILPAEAEPESIPAEAGFEAVALACGSTDEPVVFGRERPLPNLEFWREHLGTASLKAISVRPQVGRSWILCLLRAPGADPWVAEDFSLFKDIGSRISTTLGAMILYRDMRRSEEKYRTLYERSLDGIYRCAPDGALLDANPALVAMLGYSDRGELVGTMQTRLTPSGGDPHGLSDKGETFTVQLTRRDGDPVWVEVNAQPIRRAGGGIAYFEGIVRNINDRKRAEEELKASEEKLRQSQKMEAVGRLAGGVAHDFNNLLTAINGFSDLLLMGFPKEDPRRNHLQEIRRAGARAAALTSQLLSFSRKQVLAPKVLDVNAVVSGMETMLRRLIGENIGFRTRLEARLPKVIADPNQLEQVILNLVLNARDAMPSGGELLVSTGTVLIKEHDLSRTDLEIAPGEYTVLKVVDTGTGMDAETKSRLFEPFFTTKQKDKGTGLGLSTVYGAVKQANGTLAVESEPGKGTEFSIFLPSASKQGRPDKERLRERALRSMGGNETILLVEDEDAVRRLVRDVLEVGGYHVLEASGGEQALELAESQTKDTPIHLLLTDVVMGGISGRVLAEKLKAKRPEIKVLFMSGYTEDAIIRHGVYTAQASFIGKPFTPAAISAKVRDVLEGSGEKGGTAPLREGHGDPSGNPAKPGTGTP